ncbi:phosphotransferase family protein [Leptospira licerasiae]|uniref:Phosphotransferase enzyme domain protein n=1 Tax=Leptospira licerasiae str. MMD4847 TaxID=1049971 RepID=A0ABN0HBA1_9LEPT|nr:aminoglycoside phosphotransferase family protein [Leptospira licerasiae]EIE00338.1 phosphotransferase enzyme domain protein [Leptospira licerasiae serovar Varillal str. VAR 010]EJZ42950.1 phosphotransferase enzyme domain protein [Leptospira licerasiae str. MMD4847]
MPAKKTKRPSPGNSLAIGRSAEISEYGPNKILKLFFKEFPTSEVDTEYSNSVIAFSAGATSMKCYEKIKIDDRHGLIFDRLEGISLTKLPDKRPLAIFSLSKILADLHLDLHNKQTKKLKDVRSEAIKVLSKEPLSFLSKEEKKIAKQFIENLPEGSSVLHLDFHPENVVVTKDSFVIIDWMTALKGDAAADVASTVFLFQDAELWPGTPFLKVLFYTLVRKFILKGYLKRYLSVSGMDWKEVEKWRLPILIFRLGLWNIESERSALQKEIREIISISKEGK